MADGRGSRITFQNLHFTREFRNRFISSLSDPISTVVICSPFFDRLPSPFQDVFGFCIFLQRRGVSLIQIITRPPGQDLQAMTLDVAKRLAAQGVEIFIRPSPYLHAKMYHFEYEKGYFRSFVGSSNFTLGGFERNHELVTEMEGVGNQTACHREIARMLAKPSALTFTAWIAKGLQAGDEGQV